MIQVLDFDVYIYIYLTFFMKRIQHFLSIFFLMDWHPEFSSNNWRRSLHGNPKDSLTKKTVGKWQIPTRNRFDQ